MESEKLTVGRIQQLTEGQTSEDFARNMKARGITVSGSLKLPSEMISIPVAEHERLLRRAEFWEAQGVDWRRVEQIVRKAALEEDTESLYDLSSKLTTAMDKQRFGLRAAIEKQEV